MTGDKLSLQVQTDLDIISKEVPTQRVIELMVQAPEAGAQKDRPKLNIALVIDRSGSMKGEKLEYVKEAAAHVLDLLGEQDRVAIVAYDDTIITLSDSVQIGVDKRNELKNLVRNLEAGNMTNLGGGWLHGCERIASVKADGYLNRTLLLTDGLANVGITDQEELGVHAKELHARGIATSTFGVGLGFNEHLLEHMANRGGGNYYFIEHPRDIPTIFMQEFKELATITARKVLINIGLPKQVDAQVLGSWEFERTDDQLRIIVGDIAANQKRELYVRLLTPPQKKRDHLELTIHCSAENETGAISATKSSIIFKYEDQKTVQSAELNKEVMGRFASVQLADEAIKALKLEREGKAEEASRLLEMILPANAPYMSEEKVTYYQNLSRRMKKRLTEIDRKTSHSLNYTSRRPR